MNSHSSPVSMTNNKEVVIGRMFYLDSLPNVDDFVGIEDKGQIIDDQHPPHIVKIRLALYNGKAVMIVPGWIKSLENWKKYEK